MSTAAVDVGRDREAFDKRGRARFDKHGLPNSARRGVPAPLFANGLLAIVHRIFHAQHKHGSSPFSIRTAYGVSQIKFEREISSFVLAKMNAVAPTVGKIVGRAH